MAAPALSDLTRFALSGFTLGQFVDWFVGLTNGADCVVALARAAPRLLQYYDVVDKLSCPIVSERALGFLSPSFFREKRVVLFDDTVNFGSTMAETRSRLIALGASVECVAIAVDRQAFLGETVTGVRNAASKFMTELDPKYLLKASTAELDILHGLEIRGFRTMGKPYIFDFPVYEVDLKPSIRECSPSYIASMLGESEDVPFIWPSADSPAPGIRHFGIPISSDALEKLFPDASGCLEWQPFSKIRLFIDYPRLKLRLVPVIQLTSKPTDVVGETGARLRDSDPLLQRFLASVSAPLGGDLWNLSVHRSVVFALACRIAGTAWNTLLSPSMRDHIASARPELCVDDAAFVFGRDLAEEARKFNFSSIAAVDVIKPGNLVRRGAKQISYITPPDPERFSDPSLFASILARLSAVPEERPSKSHDAYENMGLLLPLLREVIDFGARDSQDVGRLLRGVTYLDLLTLLNCYGARSSAVELSSALDDLVDRGMLVPQLVHDDKRSHVRRAYRSGETIQSDTTSNRKSIVHRLLQERATFGLPYLSEFGFSKTFTILKKLFPELPYRIKPQTYGIEPFADDEVLRLWCQQHQVIQISKEPINGARRVMPTKLPKALPPWPVPHATLYPIRVIFQQIADLDSAASAVPSRQMYLLLSSCNNHQATFNGCAFELHNWFRRPFNNYDRFMSILESVDWTELASKAQAGQGLFAAVDSEAAQLRFELLANVARSVSLPAVLQECRSYLVEYRAKRDLFYSGFPQVRAALEAHFSQKPESKMLWDEMFKEGEYLYGEQDPTYATLFKLMDPIQEACWRLMDIVQAVLLKAAFWINRGSDVSLSEENALAVSISRYDDAVDRAHTLGIEVGRLQKFGIGHEIGAEPIDRWVSQARKRFTELKVAFELRFPIYDDASETPFSPSLVTKTRDVQDETLRGVYIGMFDLVGSKMAPIDIKVHVGEALEGLGCLHERTGNDEFLFVTNGLIEAVSIIESVRARTLQFVVPDGKGYGGLRASITKGDCIKRRTPHSDPRLIKITDGSGTPDIPNTAYQMNKIGELLKASSELRLEDQTRGIAVSRGLAIELTGLNDPTMSPKHELKNLGMWEVKGVTGDAFFYVPNGER
jgi:hypothetical protein